VEKGKKEEAVAYWIVTEEMEWASESVGVEVLCGGT